MKEDSCFRLDTLEDIQKTFKEIMTKTEQENGVLGDLFQHQSQRDSQFTQDPYRTPSRYRQNLQNESSEEEDVEDNLSQIVEYNDIKEPKEKPKKILNLILKNGQLIKVGEENVKNDNKQLTANDLILLQQYAKRKVSMHSKAYPSSVQRQSDVSRKTRGLSQEKLKNLKQFDAKDCDQMTELVESYGQALISTIFQSLIVHNVRASSSSQNNSSFFSSVSSTTGHLSSEIIKEFGISATVLRNFDTFDEKRQYIIQQMGETVQKLIANFKQKIKERDKSNKKEEDDIYKSNGFNQRNDPRYLDWLKIQSQYEGINLKLREMVVAQMNQYENQVKILDSMQQKGAKINELMNYVGMNTGLLLQKEQQQQIDPSNLLNKMINKGSEHDEWIKEIEETIQDMKWDEEEEEQFQNNIRSSKKQQNNTQKLTNGHSIGFSDNIYRKMKEEQQAENREYLLNKYQEGDHLNSQQVQFLANTSRLLNKCVDKAYEQQKVNTLSKDLLNNIELKIAESIISQYCKIKNGLSILRNEYLQHKAKKDAIKLQKGREQEIHKQISMQNKQYHERMTKVFRSYLNLRKKQDASNIENLSYTSKILVKAFSNKLKLKRAESLASNGSSKKMNASTHLNTSGYDNVKQSIQPQSKNRSITLQNNFMNSKTPSPTKLQINQLIGEDKKSEQKQKSIPRVGIPKSKSLETRIKSSQHHAPSKLFAYEDHLKPYKIVKDDSDIRGFRRFYNSKKYDEKQSEQYDIKLLDHPQIKNKLQFISFYSKGPGKLIEDRDRIQFVDINKPNKRLLQSTLMIQRFIRGFLGRLKVKRTKEKKLWDLQNKLIQQNKKFMKSQHVNIYNLTSQSTLKGNNSQQIFFKRADSKSSFKQNKPYFVLDQKRDLISENGEVKSRNSINSSLRIKSNYHGADRSFNKLNSQATPLRESTASMQNIQQSHFHNPKIIEGRRSISQASLQKIKTDMLRQRLGNIIAAGEGDRKKELQKLNKDFKELDREGCESNIYKSLLSNSQSPSSSSERKQASKTEKKRMQQRRQTLFRGVLNNDLNYLCLVGHRWEKTDFNQKDKHLNTPIYYACQKKNIPMIKWLFSQGADVNMICQDGNSPLHLIFGLNNIELIQFIIAEEERIDLNNRNKQGQTPLALCKQDILPKLGLEKAITVVSNQNKRINFDNNKLLNQHRNINFEEQLIQDQSYLVIQNFSLSDQKSNFNHIPSQRFIKKKSTLSIQSSISQNFMNQNKNNN